HDICFTLDGKSLVAVADGEGANPGRALSVPESEGHAINLWDLATKQKRRLEMTEPGLCVGTLALSPDGKLLVYREIDLRSISSHVIPFEMPSGKRLGYGVFSLPGAYQRPAFDPSGATLAVGGAEYGHPGSTALVDFHAKLINSDSGMWQEKVG